MRWMPLIALVMQASCVTRNVSGDQVTLCERDPLCSAHPLPAGQNGIQWTPQGGAKNAGKPATKI